MSDIKLFSTEVGVTELPSSSVVLEKDLQILIEQNMATFFGVTFLKSEYPITNGRIDSLGIDENYCPVIFEYKRSLNENVINQGLFYLDWLLDHKADFKLSVMEKLGKEVADKIDWTIPCVICIASDFTKFDEHAVNQMQRNIKLVRYRKFGNNLILFEHINAPTLKAITEVSDSGGNGKNTSQNSFLKQYDGAQYELRKIYDSIRNYIMSLGDDISENQLKFYVAFKKIKNIVCVEIYKKKILLYLKLNPDDVEMVEFFSRDMRNIGHYGTGDVQIIVNNVEDFERAKAYIDKAYHQN